MPPVLIVGHGWLAAALAHVLHERGTPAAHVANRSDRLPEASAVISCSDGPASAPPSLVALRAGNTPLITSELTATGARIRIVNPHVPGEGCISCEAEYRARRDPFDAAALKNPPSAEGPRTPPWRYRHAESDVTTAATFTMLALANARRAADVSAPVDTRVLVLNFDERTATSHAVPRHFACAACRPRRASGADALRDDTKARWESDWASSVPPLDLLEVHDRVKPLVGGEHALFDHTRATGAAERRAIGAFLAERGVKPGDTPFLDAVMTTAVRYRTFRTRREAVATGGFDFSAPRVSAALSLVEGLERLVALDHIDPSRVVRSSFAALDHLAVDPRAIALFSEEQLRDDGARNGRFDPLAEASWVWGIRLATGEPILVPTQVLVGDSSSIVQATSSGAACHSSIHHAVLNGLYELIERDALMLTWLNRWSHPRLRFAASDPDPHGLRAACAAASLRLTQVDMTADVGVPVMLGVLEDERDPALFMITMVANLSPSRALDKLYREITQFTYPHLVNTATYRTAISRSDDPAGVHTLPDHLAFYQHASKRQLTAFLTGSSEERPFAAPAGADHLPVMDEIKAVVAKLTRSGFDPVAVDCTEPFLRDLGLSCVKVIVPGLQPLQVGHGRAGLGSRRLTRTPNPWPHPFW